MLLNATVTRQFLGQPFRCMNKVKWEKGDEINLSACCINGQMAILKFVLTVFVLLSVCLLILCHHDFL